MIAAGLQVTRVKDDKEDTPAALWRAGVSEFFATAMFIFIGTGLLFFTNNKIRVCDCSQSDAWG